MDEILGGLEPLNEDCFALLGNDTPEQGWEPVWGGGQKSRLVSSSSYSLCLDCGRVTECY